MKVVINWSGPAHDADASEMAFTATTESGHVIAMDGAPASAGQSLGGRNLAARPMETVLAGTGGCTAYDVVLILRRARQEIEGCEVRLDAERAETDPKVFTRIHFHFIVRGRGVRPEMVERAIQLSHEKYCSASIMLAKTARMSHSFEIVDAALPSPPPDTSAS